MAFGVLLLALLAFYLVPDLLTRGLALDGLVYASIAQQLAQGAGGFWALPHYDGSPGAFLEHPPLGIWLLAQWMRLVGDPFWAEKAYAGLCTLGCFGLTGMLWREVSGRLNVWWPWLLLAVMPVATYTLKNNYLESALVLAALLAVWAGWRLVPAPLSAGAFAGWSMLLAGGVFAGLLIKGPVGLYPLAAPLVFAVFEPPPGRSPGSPAAAAFGLTRSIPAVLLLCACLALLLAHADARQALAAWWQNQVVASIAADRPVVHGRLYQLGNLARNLLPPVLLTGLVLWRWGRWPAQGRAWALLLLGAAASVPLLLSARQFKHYLLPSLPLFALGLGMLAQPAGHWRIRAAAVWSLVGLVLLGVLLRGYWLFGTVGDDRDEQALAAEVAAALPAGAALRWCPELSDEYAARAYLMRDHGISSSAGGAPPEPAGDAWRLCEIGDSAIGLRIFGEVYLYPPGRAG
ncbi:MAG: hypothetical protein U5Q16_09555 [Gammaproteobacteria bacterium]|nr:hypothetical protein [Gammaproteobacteria bacterium]